MAFKRIAHRGGHNSQSTGAACILNELEEDRKINERLGYWLDVAGVEHLDCTPGACGLGEDLARGVNKANEWGADVYVPIHLNNAYNSTYYGEIGTEVCVYNEFAEAEAIVKGLSDLGFKYRGQKIRQGLYDLRCTNMKAVIVETCFVEATKDVETYRKVGYDLIAKTIAEALVGHAINAPTQEPSKPHTAPFEYGIVTASALRVRKSPVDGEILAELPKGTEVHIDFEEDGWYSIFFGDHGGWISAEYVKPKDLYGVVTAKSGLKVRDGAGTGYRQIGVLSCGEKVRIGFSSADGKWHNIYFGDHGGWVSADYIRLL